MEARDEWTRTDKVSKGASLKIRGTNGRIRVEASDGDTIEVAATRIVRASTDEAAKQRRSRNSRSTRPPARIPS